MQRWNKLKVTGKKPSGRVGHTTSCITKGSSPIVAVVGGVGEKKLTYADVWLLDVRKGQWSEVRMWYSCVSCSDMLNLNVSYMFT